MPAKAPPSIEVVEDCGLYVCFLVFQLPVTPQLRRLRRRPQVSVLFVSPIPIIVFPHPLPPLLPRPGLPQRHLQLSQNLLMTQPKLPQQVVPVPLHQDRHPIRRAPLLPLPCPISMLLLNLWDFSPCKVCGWEVAEVKNMFKKENSFSNWGVTPGPVSEGDELLLARSNRLVFLLGAAG